MSGKNERVGRVISTPEALEILEKRKKDGDLGYEQQVSYDHIKKFSKLDSSKAQKLCKQIEELGVSEKSSIQIVDVLPMNLLQLKQVLANEKNAPDQEVVDKILKLITDNAGKS